MFNVRQLTSGFYRHRITDELPIDNWRYDTFIRDAPWGGYKKTWRIGDERRDT